MFSFLRCLSPVQLSTLAGMVSFSITVFPPVFPFFSFLLSFFSAIPVYFVGFVYGKRSALLAGAVVFFLLAVFFNITAASLYFLSTVVPLMVIINSLGEEGGGLNIQEQSSLPLGNILSHLSIMGLLVFFAGTALFSITQDQDPLVFLTKKIVLLYSSAFPVVSPVLILLVPSIIFLSTVFSTFLNVVLTISCLKLMDIPSPSRSNADLRIPPYWDIILCLGLLLQFWKAPLAQFIGTNIVLISSVPLFVFGLKIVSDIFNLYNIKKGFFNLFVLGCFFLLVWIGPFVVLIGVLEPLLKIRKRLS